MAQTGGSANPQKQNIASCACPTAAPVIVIAAPVIRSLRARSTQARRINARGVRHAASLRPCGHSLLLAPALREDHANRKIKATGVELTFSSVAGLHRFASLHWRPEKGNSIPGEPCWPPAANLAVPRTVRPLSAGGTARTQCHRNRRPVGPVARLAAIDRRGASRARRVAIAIMNRALAGLILSMGTRRRAARRD